MAGMGDFRYVDFASRALRGFRNNVVTVNDLTGLAKRHGQSDCFCTYFLFDRGLPAYVKGNGRSVAGYQGPCYAHCLPLDIDGEDLGRALQTAGEISRHLLDRWGVPEQSLAVYYSGSKGFHLTVATAVFGEVEPGTALPQVFREVRRSIANEAKVKHPEAVDFSICDRLRLLRLPNTRHSKSGLYKVPLRVEELLFCDPEEIRHIARKPRQPWLTDASGLLPRYRAGPVSGAMTVYERCAERAEKHSHAGLPDPGSFLDTGDLSKALCESELSLYQKGVPEGARSGMALRFASRFRSAGYPEEDACAMIESFAGRCRPPLEEHTARRIVEVAYRAQGRGYQFGCGTGNGDPPQTRLVHEACPYTDRTECETFRGFESHLQKGGLTHQ